MVSVRTRKKALVYKYWFKAFLIRVKKLESLKDQVETLAENRMVTVFVTAFVSWRHCTKRRRIEIHKRQSIDILLRRSRLSFWLKACLSRNNQRQLWFRLAQSAYKHWHQQSLCNWNDFHGELSELEAFRTRSTFLRLKLLLKVSRTRKQQVLKFKQHSFRTWNACRLLVSLHRSNYLKKTILVWMELHKCLVLHRERMGLKVLRALYSTVIESSLRSVLQAWRWIVLEASREVETVLALRALLGWWMRTKANRELTEKIPVIRLSTSRNLVRRFRLVFDRLRQADQYYRTRLSDRGLSGWFMKLSHLKSERRKSRFLSRRSHIHSLKAVWLKWIARAACSLRTKYRERLVQQRCWIRWKAFNIDQRVSKKKKFMANRFRQSSLASKALRSIRSVVCHVRTLNNITAPLIRQENLLRRVWDLWTMTVRPVLQREIAVQHRVARFSFTRLACKSLRILLTHSTEKKWKRVEETLNRTKYRNLQLKRFGSELCLKLQSRLHAANSLRRFHLQLTANRRKAVFNHLKIIHGRCEDQNAILRHKTVHFAFRQLKWKIQTIQKNRVRLNSNILEKFLLLWMQYLSCVLFLRLRFARLHSRISSKTKRSALSEWVACFNQAKVASAYHRISVTSHERARVLLGWNKYASRLTCMRSSTREIQRKLLHRRLVGVKRAVGSVQRRRKMESLIAIQDAVERDRGKVISSVLLARRVFRGWRNMNQDLNDDENAVFIKSCEFIVDSGKLASLRLRIDQLRENLIVIRD